MRHEAKKKKVPEACRGLWNFFYAKMLTDDFQTKPIMLTDGFQTESIMLKWGHGVRKLLRAHAVKMQWHIG